MGRQWTPKSDRGAFAKRWLVLLMLLSGFSNVVIALPTAVLSNLNQPSLGAFDPLSSLDYLAVPFVTDDRFTQLDGVEINAVTLSSPGRVFVQIWDMNTTNGQPGTAVATLLGSPEPAGLTQYTGTANLLPDTSYFLVIGVANAASSAGTAVYTADRNQADSQPPPIYRIGTDFDGDGTIDFVNKCTGSVVGSATTWVCGGVSATRFFPKFRIFAEEPVPTMPPAPPSLTSNPLFLDFGTVAQGITSAPLAATIENNGGVDQIFGSVSLASGTPFALDSDTCSGATLAPGATCMISATFTPGGGGQFSDTVILPLSTDPSSPYGLQLVGEGDTPPIQSLTTTPAGLDFGVVDQGTTSAPEVIQIINNGTANQTLGSLSVTGAFALSSNPCDGVLLLPMQMCQVSITFSPILAGLTSGALQIPAAGDTKSPYSVPLSGEGNTLPSYTYSLTSTPLSLDFGVVPDGTVSAPETAVIENDGNVAQVIGTISVGSGFALASDSCSGITLAAGSTCSISLTFSPAHGGVNTGTAIIPTATDPRSPYGLGLSGESDQSGTALPPSGSAIPKPVPLRFTLLTALSLIAVVALRRWRLRKGRSSRAR